MTALYITIWSVCLSMLYVACMYYKHRESLQWEKYDTVKGLGWQRCQGYSMVYMKIYLLWWVLKGVR